MEVIKFRKGLKYHTLEIYDDIDEIPINNFAHLEKNLLIEGGVGVTIGDFDSRLELMIQFITTGHKDKALNEVNNMRNLFWNITEKVRPDTDAFSCLLHKIDGKVRVASDSGISQTSEILQLIGATKEMIDKRRSIKKKMDDQLITAFPDLSGLLSIDLIGAQRRKLTAQLDEIINGEDNSKKIEREDSKVSTFIQSKEFGEGKGADVIYMSQYNKMKMLLQKQVSIPINEMSTRDFYSLAELHKAA